MASVKESVDEMVKVTSPNTECMMKYLDVNQETVLADQGQI